MRNLIDGIRHRDEWEWNRLRPFQAHSKVLVVAGLAYALYGTLLVTASHDTDRLRSISWVLHWIPLTAWGIAWWVVALTAITSARWPPASETWGYSVMAGFSYMWGSLYLLGWLLHGQPIASVGATLIWWLFAYIWIGVSALVNPEVVKHSIKRAFEQEG